MSENGYILYARPSFLEGLARLVDFTGSLNTYNSSNSPEEADSRALMSDWEAVGLDLISAYEEFVKETLK